MTDLSLNLRGGVLVDERNQNFPATGASHQWHRALGQRWRRLLHDQYSDSQSLGSFVGMSIRHLSHLELLLRWKDAEVLDTQLFCAKELYGSLSRGWSLHGPIGGKWRGGLSEVCLHQRQCNRGQQRQQCWKCSQLGPHTRDCRLALAGGAA